MTVSEKTVFKLAAEYAARLGVSVPEIVVQNARVKTFDYHQTRTSVGLYGGKWIMIDRRRSFHSVRNTVAHEFIHRAFPRLRHGDSFDERVDGLVRGELFFRGSMRKGGIKTVSLDLNFPSPPVSKSETTALLEARIRAFDTKIKRLTTLRKKLIRRLKRKERSK